MKRFIFDLDWTLYNSRDNINETTDEDYYNSFKPKIFLVELLRELNEKVYIFTNGNTSHAIEVLTRLGLKKIYPDTNIITRDHIQYLKPHPDGYSRAISNFKIHRDDEVYFFEDTYENLLTAKKFGWKTVLVGNKKPKDNNFIDFTFDHIEEALLFFLIKKKFTKNDFN